MPSARQGSIHLFRFARIDVFLHWSWFLVAAYEISNRKGSYSSVTWNVLEYLALFLMVTLHEFGHALACRQVGGTADTIVLWPLGGVAYVNPPQRPGATLWSIAAGPLVNVVLAVILFIAGLLSRSLGWAQAAPDSYGLLRAVYLINLYLLIFNILPIYPLDGGQILRSLLWFVLGRARSLMAATIIGLLGVAGLVFIAIRVQSVWLGAICFFILINCWSGFKQAQALSRFAKLPRREEFRCPTCKMAPPVGEYRKCAHCGQPFDTFQTRAACPHCSSRFDVTRCPDCGALHPMHEWTAPVVAISATFRRDA
jgi:Zn-dependent protease